MLGYLLFYYTKNNFSNVLGEMKFRMNDSLKCIPPQKENKSLKNLDTHPQQASDLMVGDFLLCRGVCGIFVDLADYVTSELNYYYYIYR